MFTKKKKLIFQSKKNFIISKPIQARIILLILLSFFCFEITQAQNTKKNLNMFLELSLEELMEIKVYSATKKPKRIMDAPSVISVIARIDIERMNVTSLIDVLKFTPAIEVSMGKDGNYRLSIRGERKEGNILVLLNGHHINNFYNGSVIYDLNTSFIEKIEVIRGPGSALFGTNAVAGIINIFTIKNENSATILAGKDSTYSGFINYSFSKNNLLFSLSTGYSRSNGANNELNQDRGFKYPWSLTYGDKKTNTERWLKDGYLNLDLKINQFQFSLFGITRNRGTWIGHDYILGLDSDYKTDQIVWNVSYNFNISEGIILTSRVFGDVLMFDHKSQERPPGYISPVSKNTFPNGRFTKEKYTALDLGIELQADFFINENFDIISGVVFENLSLPDYELERNYKIVGDIYQEQFGNYDNIILDQKDKKRDIFAFYVQGIQKWKKLEITAGFRVDWYSDFGTSINPRAGLVYKPFDKLNFKFLYGKAFRAPTFKELYDKTNLGKDAIIGNKDLRPETVQTLELAAELAVWKLKLSSNVFYNINSDKIDTYDPSGSGGIGWYKNIGNSKSYGYEFETIAVFNKNLKYFINLSWFRTEFEWNEKLPFLGYQELHLNNCQKKNNNIPGFRINSGVFFNLNKFSGFFGLNYGMEAENNNRFYLESDHRIKIEAYLQYNLSITYNLNPKLSFRFAANNIGEKYSDPDASTNIDAFGSKGMIQPGSTYVFSIIFRGAKK